MIRFIHEMSNNSRLLIEIRFVDGENGKKFGGLKRTMNNKISEK